MAYKKWFSVLIVITICSLLLRLGLSYELFRNDAQVSRPSSATDMATYIRLAGEIYEGKFKGEFYYQPFYYAVFLPLIYHVAGRGVWQVLFFQAIISAATVYLAGICALRIAGRRAAFAAAAMAGFSTILSFYVAFHLIATLLAFWVILILYLSIMHLKTGKMLYCALGGLTLGFGILTRGNLWFFLPVILCFSICVPLFSTGSQASKPSARALKACLNAAAILFFVFLPQLPFAARNSRISGKLSGASTASGVVLALGNTPEAPPGGRNPGTGAGPMEYPETYHFWMGSSDKIPVISRIFRWMVAEPGAFTELQFRKLLLFWDWREIPNNVALETQGIKSLVLNSLCIVPTSIMLASGLAGIMAFLLGLMRTRGIGDKAKCLCSPESLCVCLIAAYWLATAAFYNLSRFRVPCVPLLAVLGGVYVERFLLSAKSHSRRRILHLHMPVLLLSLFIVYLAYDTYRFNFESSVMRLVRPGGTSVNLGDRTVTLDNGPASFGAWSPLAVGPGDRLVKSFALPPGPHPGTATFTMPLICPEGGGSIKLKIGGKVVLEKLTEQFNEFKTQMPLPDNGSVEIEFIECPGELYCIEDMQRDYGRTSINGKATQSELVSRIYLGENSP